MLRCAVVVSVRHPGDTMPALLHARPPTDPAEERRLRKLAAARHAPASWIQRARIITGSWDGASVAELAQRLGCHTKTVSKWLHRFNTGGIDGLADLPRPGVPRRISEAASSPWPAPSHLASFTRAARACRPPTSPRRRRPGRWTPWPRPPAPKASRWAAARSAGSSSASGCAGGGLGRG